MKLHVVITTWEGVIDEPAVFTNEDEALAHYNKMRRDYLEVSDEVTGEELEALWQKASDWETLKGGVLMYDLEPGEPDTPAEEPKAKPGIMDLSSKVSKMAYFGLYQTDLSIQRRQALWKTIREFEMAYSDRYDEAIIEVQNAVELLTERGEDWDLTDGEGMLLKLLGDAIAEGASHLFVHNEW